MKHTLKRAVCALTFISGTTLPMANTVAKLSGIAAGWYALYKPKQFGEKIGTFVSTATETAASQPPYTPQSAPSNMEAYYQEALALRKSERLWGNVKTGLTIAVYTTVGFGLYYGYKKFKRWWNSPGASDLEPMVRETHARMQRVEKTVDRSVVPALARIEAGQESIMALLTQNQQQRAEDSDLESLESLEARLIQVRQPQLA